MDWKETKGDTNNKRVNARRYRENKEGLNVQNIPFARCIFLLKGLEEHLPSYKDEENESDNVAVCQKVRTKRGAQEEPKKWHESLKRTERECNFEGLCDINTSQDSGTNRNNRRIQGETYG